MDLPSLLPHSLGYTQSAQNARDLIEVLATRPADFITFVEFACDDETWSENHKDFIRGAIHWLTSRYLQDKLPLEHAQRAVKAIQPHIQITRSLLDRNLTFDVEGELFQENSLMWAAASDDLHDWIRHESFEKNQHQIRLEQVPLTIFPKIEEYIETGTIESLAHLAANEIIAILRVSTEWGLRDLMIVCENLLKKYVTEENATSNLIEATAQDWKEFKESCVQFINDERLGVRLESKELHQLFFEFENYKVKSLKLFEALRGIITHLGFTGSEFENVSSQCPKLLGISLAQTSEFKSGFLEFPSTIKVLDLSKCEWLTAEHLTEIFKQYPQIKELNLAYNKHLTYREWSTLYELKNLQILDISQCNVGDEERKIITQAAQNLIVIEP